MTLDRALALIRIAECIALRCLEVQLCIRLPDFSNLIAFFGCDAARSGPDHLGSHDLVAACIPRVLEAEQMAYFMRKRIFHVTWSAKDLPLPDDSRTLGD